MKLTPDQIHIALIKLDPKTQRLPTGMLMFARAIESLVSQEYEARIAEIETECEKLSAIIQELDAKLADEKSALEIATNIIESEPDQSPTQVGLCLMGDCLNKIRKSSSHLEICDEHFNKFREWQAR